MSVVTPRSRSAVPETGRRLAAVLGGGLVLLAATVVAGRADRPTDANPARLTSRARTEAPAAKTLAVGQEIRTTAGQRQRVLLPDGSILFVNQNSKVKLDDDRTLTLSGGEVFVEVQNGAAVALTVKTAKRELRSRGARFAVRASDDGTGVIVAGGRVEVVGLDTPLQNGQQLTADGKRPVTALRVSRHLDWTRDLMAAAETPLVPGNVRSGGALTATDANGRETQLSLRRYRVDVHIEDGFACTTIDQTYFNDSPQRLEGTFYFPLPPDASLSRLAMYVDGKRMEGGMAERDYARNVYEEIVYRQQDPALLEWLDGNTFKMRVFPLEARQEKRLLLSYTQQLPALAGRLTYRFPAGHSLGVVGDWALHARIKDGAGLAWESPSHELTAAKDGADLQLDARARNVSLDRDVVLHLDEPRAAPESVRFSSSEQDGSRYLMLRYRPELTGPTERQRRDWVFLVETSGDRDPLLARAQVEVVRAMLANAEPDDTFSVLTAGTRTRAAAEKPQPVSAGNVQTALAFLEQAHLIGALDLGRALNEAGPLLKTAKNPYLVHVGSGIAAMGERRDDHLVKRLPAGVRYVGVGVGRRWGRSFMKLAAERRDGWFTQINPDESISWRAFELAATLGTPRLLNVQVAAGPTAFLGGAAAVAQGEELSAIARLGADDKLPETVTIRGTLAGEKFERVLPVKAVAENADYLPRAWAKLEIDRLLAEDADKNKPRIVALSKAMYVMTPFTSLLVLENDAMYEQFKVDRGRKDHWALYAAPAQIPVVYEPLPGMAADPRGLATAEKPNAGQVRQTIAVRGVPRILGVKRDLPNVIGFGGVAMLPGAPDPVEQQPIVTNVQIVGAPSPAPLQNQLIAVRGLVDFDGSIHQDSVLTPILPPIPPQPTTVLDPDTRSRSTQSLRTIQNLVSSPSSSRSQELLNTSEDLRQIQYEYERIWFTDQPSHLTPERVHGGIDSPVNNLRVNVDETRTGSLMFGVGVNSDAGLTGSIVLNERGAIQNTLLYRRPSAAGDESIFSDLLAYAPGMNTSAADLLTVIEAEAAPSPASLPGRIDPAVRKLIEQARSAGWQTLTIDMGKGRPAWSITFDGSGRYAWERVLPPGLRERVVCDGSTLLHMYPDLGIGARRSVSRAHRLDLARLVPSALPTAEDLARGADLIRVDDQTVALVPRAAATLLDNGDKLLPYRRLHLVFRDGRLSERQVVQMPEGRVLLRETLGADGVVRLLDRDNKELASRKNKLAAAEAPSLKADLKGLVVLPLPYRTADHIKKELERTKKTLNELPAEKMLPLFAAHVGTQNGNAALQLFNDVFYRREQRQLGFYVLLAASGVNLDAEHANVLAEHPDEPLAQYLALYSSPVLRKHASQWAVNTGQWADGFLRQLAVTHALYQRWQSDRALAGTDAQRRTETTRALDYIRKQSGSAFGWALLGLMQDRVREAEAKGRDLRDLQRDLATAFLDFVEVPGLEYFARYEHARILAKTGQSDAARKEFRELYEKTFAAGKLPPLDDDFRQALLGDGKQADDWGALMRRSAAHLIEKKERPAVLTLAQQCRQLGDQALADHLLGVVLDGVDAKHRLPLTVAVIDQFAEAGQLLKADHLLQGLLDDPKLARRSALWRIGARLASLRNLKARELTCLEKALEAEQLAPPAALNVKVARADHERLLRHYQNLAEAMVALEIRPPADFRAKVLRAADRWRALGGDQADACDAAAEVLHVLGERDLAWDYLTTPVGVRPGEASPWLKLAAALQHKGDADLADRAFAAAFEVEPTNAQVLWDRARNLHHAGKPNEARALYRQLAEGQWQPRYQGLQVQARWQLQPR